MTQEPDVKIVVCRRTGRSQSIRLQFTESALEKLKGSSERFREGAHLIEEELAKDLFHDKPLEAMEFIFPADDPDFIEEEAQDVADKLLSRMKLISRVYREDQNGQLKVAA